MGFFVRLSRHVSSCLFWSQVEVPHLITAITIKAVSFTSLFCIFIILTDDLDDAFEAAEKWQADIVQTNKQFGMREGLVMSDDYGHGGGLRILTAAMRHESGGWKMPQQLVELVSGGFVRHVQQYTQTVLHCFLAQLASGAQLVVRAGVEIYFSHFAAARLTRYCVSNGTGRPVEPFSLPDFQAVPAISKCAQR